MLVKNLLKRGLSVLICTAMLAVMFTSVTALADNYEITDSTFTDELTDTSYLYSYPNNPEDWNLTQNTAFKENGQDVSGYSVCYQGEIKNRAIPKTANICYKAGESKKFTKATFTIWINNDSAKAGSFPVVKAKADADSEFEAVNDVNWETLTAASAGTNWYRKSECTVYFPEGAVIAGLGFDGKLKEWAFIFDKAEFMIGNEVTKLYDDCSSLDNVWLAKNLNAISDVVGEGDYNNGGHMIGAQKVKAYEAIYKIPEGRKLTYLSVEYSVQNNKNPKIAFSSDGVNFTDYTLTGVGSDKAGTAGNAKYADVKTVTYTPSESDNIRFIKIYGDNLQYTYEFYLRKVNLAISSYSLFKKDGETVTNLNGKAESGNLFGKIYYTPKDGETDFYTIIALKENNVIKNIELKNIPGVTSATNVFETPELKNCVINDNTVVEVYLFNMTDGSLKPVLSEKGEFSK